METSDFELTHYNSKLNILNNLPDIYLLNEFLRCCGSSKWASDLLSYKPYSSFQSLIDIAERLWWLQTIEEWKTAFKAHPKIGDANALKQKFSHGSWEGEEQKGASQASNAIIEELSDLNDAYLNKHGFIFLICATGKSAFEMLEALKLRYQNDTATELQNAAFEQSKITQLRIKKLLDSLTTQNSKL